VTPHPGFFAFENAGRSQPGGTNPMIKSKSTMAHQIAQAAIAFEQRRTGNHQPKSVTVVLSEGTLVITLHEALSPAERALAKSPAGAIQMQEYHRQLFARGTRRPVLRLSQGVDSDRLQAYTESVGGYMLSPTGPATFRTLPPAWAMLEARGLGPITLHFPAGY
jgi:hypothetical protein